MTTATAPITKEAIKELIENNSAALERAIIAIFERQTEDEKVSESTTHHNKRGFSAFDAEFLTSLAKQIESSPRLPGFRLSDRQKFYARKKMVRYAGQLVIVAQEKAAAKAGVS